MIDAAKLAAARAAVGTLAIEKSAGKGSVTINLARRPLANFLATVGAFGVGIPAGLGINRKIDEWDRQKKRQKPSGGPSKPAKPSKSSGESDKPATPSKASGEPDKPSTPPKVSDDRLPLSPALPSPASLAPASSLPASSLPAWSPPASSAPASYSPASYSPTASSSDAFSPGETRQFARHGLDPERLRFIQTLSNLRQGMNLDRKLFEQALAGKLPAGVLGGGGETNEEADVESYA